LYALCQPGANWRDSHDIRPEKVDNSAGKRKGTLLFVTGQQRANPLKPNMPLKTNHQQNDFNLTEGKTIHELPF